MRRIKEGLFFTTPAALPRGRHGIPREDVVAAQHERAMIAAAELMAEGGYRSFGVREICARASLSRAAFYECFDDKDDCVFAAYDRFIEVLLQRMRGVTELVAPEVTWDAYVPLVVRAYLEAMQLDPVVVRAFQIEMDALGAEARRKRREALRTMAAFLMEAREELDPEARDQVPLSAYIGAIYAARQLASDALDEDGDADVLALVPEISIWAGQMLKVSKEFRILTPSD
ncbi:TetR/AcrR family transcriptional regulator [Spirillospora sp. NPDC050679]